MPYLPHLFQVFSGLVDMDRQVVVYGIGDGDRPFLNHDAGGYVVFMSKLVLEHERDVIFINGPVEVPGVTASYRDVADIVEVHAKTAHSGRSRT